MRSETELAQVKSCQELGNPAVFEQLFDAYSVKLYRYIYLHLSSKEDAEDVLATTFVRLWEYVIGHPSAPIKSISALLYRIARNLVIDQYRARKPSLSVEALAEAGIEIPDALRQSHTHQVELALIVEKMKALDPEERDILLLRFIEDIAVKDIAELYEITENNASVRIHRALAKLKEIANY